MRLPNGYGSVYKLSGNRRKPWVARKTTGFNDKGHPIYKRIGYYENKKIALQALAEYNKSPYDIDTASITFEEVYTKWSKKKFNEISDSATRTYKSAYSYCSPLYNMKMCEIKASHLQGEIDEAEVGNNTKSRIKGLFNLLYEYCLINEIVKVNYAALVKPPKVTVETVKVPFSTEEINKLWENKNTPYVDLILIQIYTGFRPSELCELTFIKNIDMQEWVITGGMKTEAGKDRKVPISKKIQPLIININEKGYNHLVSDEQGPINYYRYNRVFKELMTRLNMNHTPHECRHTFATLLDNLCANKVTIQRLMGHASKGVTDKVYTYKDITELRKAIDLL